MKSLLLAQIEESYQIFEKENTEGLVDKLNDPDWVPDFGPKKVHIKSRCYRNGLQGLSYCI